MRSGSVILARVRRAENPGTARANCFLGAGWVPAKMRRRGTAAAAALNEVKGLGAAVAVWMLAVGGLVRRPHGEQRECARDHVQDRVPGQGRRTDNGERTAPRPSSISARGG